MKNWAEYWEKMPKRFKEQDFLRQVGKTLGGEVITQEQFKRIVVSLQKNLAIQKDDKILDLCCGNGLITYRLAPLCGSIVGVDYSQPLIKVARKYHGGDGIRYLRASILNLLPERLTPASPFSKIYMYEALQHFSHEELPQILRLAKELAQPGARVFFGSVPDYTRIWNFYNTPERQAEYRQRVAAGQEAIGTWWLPQEIEDAANKAGFTLNWIDQDPDLHTAHYRFDFLLQDKRKIT